MLRILNKGVAPYKALQLKIFFRFLKEYKSYSEYIKKLNEFFDNELSKENYIFDYHRMKYIKVISYDILVNHYLYGSSPIHFLNIMRDKILRDMWYYHIIDYHISHNDCSPFDTVDIEQCCKMLGVNYKKYCKKFYKEWQRKENQNYLQKR